MKLEVGMYVRTNDGDLYKVYGTGKNYGEDIIYVSQYLILHDSILNDWIKKSSFNLIDLIEVGDYVNGCKIINVYLHNKLNEKDNCVETEEQYLYNEDIEEILTHELYEANCYKVE